MATKREDSCRENSADDEPLFTLCGRDPFAPVLVMMWAQMAKNQHVSARKIKEARDCAKAMRAWAAKNGTRMPG